MRFGILSVANLHPLLHVCEEAGDARTARVLYSQTKPHIVVLDISLPHGDGIELMREFSGINPGCRFVVVSGLCDCAVVQRAFRAGANGYVSKTDPAAEIFCALEAVLVGGDYMSKSISESLRLAIVRKPANRALTEVSRLSLRELHIFRRIAKGQTTLAIARELGVSVKTIQTHQGRIKTKLQLITMAQLRLVAATWLACSMAI